MPNLLCVEGVGGQGHAGARKVVQRRAGGAVRARQHADLSARYREAISGHWPLIGMTEETAPAGWGGPDKVARWPGTWGFFERWTYMSKCWCTCIFPTER